MTSPESRILSRARAIFPFSDSASDRFPISSNDLSLRISYERANKLNLDANFASSDRLSTSSRSSFGFTFAKVTSNFSSHGMRSSSLSFTSLYCYVVLVFGAEGFAMQTHLVVVDQRVDSS